MASNTGIIPLSAIKNAFPKYDPFMLIGFMKSLELCQVFKAGLLNDISTNLSPLPSDVSSEDLLFFPSLIATVSPAVMSAMVAPSFGWCLWCPNPHQFLSTRFLKVLLLRLGLLCLPTPPCSVLVS